VSCCDDETGSGDFSRITTVKARKPHKCVECMRTIGKGETYVRFAGKAEGSMFVDPICVDCDAWGRAFVKAARQHVEACHCWAVGGLWDGISEFCREALGYDPKPRVRRAA
jgi:hypothetical protein